MYVFLFSLTFTIYSSKLLAVGGYNMDTLERYEKIDIPFYKEKIAPFLPKKILDFHTHLWKYEHWIQHEVKSNLGINNSTALGTLKSARYMVTEVEYGVEKLQEDGRRMFPDKEYYAVVFGNPTPMCNLELTNMYISNVGSAKNLFPLMVVRKNMYSKDDLKSKIIEGGFFGYKVFLPWVGNDYGNIKVEDMIGSTELEVAEELGLVVILHVPGAQRLANPEVQDVVVRYANMYPNVNIVLAHCGRCYGYEEMKASINSIKYTENIYLDTSMVMDPIVLEIVFDNIDSKRVLYGTDLPVAAMRGRRVFVMDHWVDVVLEGYPESDFRVASNTIRATFMTWEIALAVRIAGEMAGLSNKEISCIFYDNGIKLLKNVRGGYLLRKKL
jgi:hypothetical protein